MLKLIGRAAPLATAVTAAVLLLATQASAAIVGAFTAQGDVITAPLAFNTTVFNSFQDVPGGLQFTIAPGLQGPVKLELLQSTANVKVAAAAIGSAFGISQSLPLAITSPEIFAAGIHSFAVGAVTVGQSEGAIVARLTLTPVPGALFLGLSGAAMIGGLALTGRRRPSPQAV
jgi:hypothetical protein